MVCDGFGPASVYLDSGSADEDDWIANASQQEKASVDKISRAADRGELEEVEKYLDNFFGILFLQIVSASNLPNMDAGMFSSASDLTDAFVVLRLGGQECDRTRTIKDNLNPIWDEEFIVNPPLDARWFRLDVADSDTDQWTGSDVEQIGFVQVDFRRTPGRWVECQENLRHAKTGTAMTNCYLSFKYYFATSVKHLVSDDGISPVSFAGSLSRSRFLTRSSPFSSFGLA